MHSVWVGHSRPYQVSFLSQGLARLEMRHTRVLGAGHGLKQCLPNFLNMLLYALPQIYTRVFHLEKSIDLDSALMRYFRPYQLSLLLKVLARLEMRHTRVLNAGISSNASRN